MCRLIDTLGTFDTLQTRNALHTRESRYSLFFCIVYPEDYASGNEVHSRFRSYGHPTVRSLVTGQARLTTGFKIDFHEWAALLLDSNLSIIRNAN